jgi:two-component system, NtrC family, sensor kinase
MPVVWTIEERCKRCYTCIRECPAKAIKVEKGQAKVIADRCVGCGHCVRVCTQQAKAVLSGTGHVRHMLDSDETVVAMLAPSFPAACPDVEPDRIIGALRALGFRRVVEVAFGADLVNREYVRVSRATTAEARGAELPVMTTACPAINNYVVKYASDLVDNLAPIVSPMIAMGRIVRRMYGAQVRTVFIGPCAAKKLEMTDPEVADAVDEVLTFSEMEAMLAEASVDMRTAAPSDFDPPHPNLGRLYPISGGLIRSSGLPFDLMDNDIILTEGKARALKLIECLQNREVSAKMADVLFCEGCINGPFMNHSSNHFMRKQRVVEYTESRRSSLDYEEWKHALEECGDVPLSRRFTALRVPSMKPSREDLAAILERINKFTPADELNCGSCGYDSCRDYATAVYQGLAEEEMCSPFLIDKLQLTQTELKDSLTELADTQEQLIQHEKLASIGQLAAGVAHEVNNPLGSIMLFSHLILQQLDDTDPKTKDVRFIIDEAGRCQKIVSGLLDFAREGRLTLQRHTVQSILDKLVAIVEKHSRFASVVIERDVDAALPALEIDGDQIYQVCLNIAMNAAEAMPDGGTLRITAARTTGMVVLRFTDTGCGIAPEHMGKVFTPFFTTKQIGHGTGLGLAIAYGIIKMHRGNIRVESTPGTGTTFIIELPISQL